MIWTEALFPLVGVLPVLCFLGALFTLDSFRIVVLGVVVTVVACGALAALLGYFSNDWAMHLTGMPLRQYSRYLSPLIEEALKAAIVVGLIRMRRIGFLVDAAILGFAAGTGFALVENIYIHLLHLIPASGLLTWIIRGFGTAIMHGGSTAIFAVTSLGLMERRPGHLILSILPGLAIAIGLHSLFNLALLSPLRMTILLAIIMPLLFYGIFGYSEIRMRAWLGQGFDADEETLALLDSGQLADSSIGRYLDTLRDRFSGPVVADVLCYLRLYTELGLRARGILMMREGGFDPPPDPEVAEKFAEMKYLERSIGRTGLLAIRPMLHISQHDLLRIHRLDH